MTEIRFGTSGWRAIMAEEFTFENVRRAVTGIARYVKEQNARDANLIIGRDPRFLGETFVQIAAEIVAAHGIKPLVISDAAPTPAIAYEVIRRKAAGAINFTASHNPAEYNGIKFSTPDGAPALPEVTQRIESHMASATTVPQATGSDAHERIEVKPAYLARLREIIDLELIKKAKLRVVFDPLWGAARGYSDSLLHQAGIAVHPVHDSRDVLFGGHAPEPDDHVLQLTRAKLREIKAHIGIATDGDADRFGILDQDGAFISPNYVIALLFDYLVESRGWKNGVGKSVVTTKLVKC